MCQKTRLVSYSFFIGYWGWNEGGLLDLYVEKGRRGERERAEGWEEGEGGGGEDDEEVWVLAEKEKSCKPC